MRIFVGNVMKSSAWIWRITASVSIIVTIVLIFGFVYAFKDINDPQGQPLLTGGESAAPGQDCAGEAGTGSVGSCAAK